MATSSVRLHFTWLFIQASELTCVCLVAGTDKYGNQYFENKVDYAHGQHRWVKLAENGKGCYSFYTADPTAIEPSWFPWLHHQTDEAPTSTTVGSTHRVEPQKNAHGSSAPYARNLGGVITAPYPNQTMVSASLLLPFSLKND